jgi:uncharacterized protein (TIGR02646 family)
MGLNGDRKDAAPWEFLYRRGKAPPELSEVRSERRLRLLVLPLLRRDFADRCCYCTGSTDEKGGEENFEVEHFRPKGRKEFAHLAFDYSNLYYACQGCNRAKGVTWSDSEEDARRFIDPCVEAIYPTYLRIAERGEIRPCLAPGPYLLEVFKFNKRPGIKGILLRREFSAKLRSAIRAGHLAEAQILLDNFERMLTGQ